MLGFHVHLFFPKTVPSEFNICSLHPRTHHNNPRSNGSPYVSNSVPPILALLFMVANAESVNPQTLAHWDLPTSSATYRGVLSQAFNDPEPSNHRSVRVPANIKLCHGRHFPRKTHDRLAMLLWQRPGFQTKQTLGSGHVHSDSFGNCNHHRKAVEGTSSTHQFLS